jgi:hypothetical protein
MNQIECGETMIDITEQDEQEEMLAKFWADYGESMWVDPAEQEELWDEKIILQVFEPQSFQVSRHHDMV